MRQISPKLKGYLDAFNAQIPVLIQNGFKANAINAREWLAQVTKDMALNIPNIAAIWDDLVTVPGHGYQVPVRIFHPAPNEERPVLVHFHGGGHMAGSVSAYDPIIRKFAVATGHIVVSVEYRLAPENPFPAGFVDAYNAVKYIWPVLESRKIKYKRELSLIGDSAGGALVASILNKAQFDATLQLKKAIMIYPGLDYTLSCPSIQQNAVGYLLQTSKVVWYYDHYLQNCENRKEISPLFGDFTKRMPETFVITAEFCPLRDEGILYCEKMKQAGIKVKHLHFDDMPHTFMNLEKLVPEECDRVYREVKDFLSD